MGFLGILSAVIPVFLIVCVGFVLQRLHVISDESERTLMRIVINVLYPCFILSKVPGNEALQGMATVGVSLGAGFFFVVCALAISFVVGRVLGIRSDDGLGTFCLSTSIQNYGFFPIPLIIALFGDAADQTLGVLFIHNLGLEIAMWTVGIMTLSGSLDGAGRRLLNAPTIAIAVGLGLNFSGLHSWIPHVAGKAITELGNCSIPVSLILIGATLANVLQRETWQTQLRVILGGLVVRFGVMPVLFLAVAAWVASVSSELRNVLIVESSMPAAIFPLVLAKYFGGRPGVAVQVILTTSAVSLLMTPLILLLALKFFSIPY